MNQEEYYSKIQDLFRSKDCFTKDVCGSNRTELKGNGFFPPPLTHIGSKYPEADTKIFALAINQNLKKEEECSFEKARDCLCIEKPWFAPLENVERISQIIFRSLSNQIIENDKIRDFISFSNFVKCSSTPTTPSTRSKDYPTDEMVRNCKGFTLEEIKILRPDIIVCMGRIPFDGILGEMKDKNISLLKLQDYDSFSFRFHMGEKEVKVIRVYHCGDMRTLYRMEKYYIGEIAQPKFTVLNKFFERAFGREVSLKEYSGLLKDKENMLNNYYETRNGDKYTPPLLAKFIIRELVEKALKE